MLTGEDQSKPAATNEPEPKLATEGPLCEKDQQGMAIERTKKLGEEALEQWRRLKEKKHPYI
jgi:hypothetical protein